MRIILALLLLCSSTLAADLHGKCVRVIDGDTVVVLVADHIADVNKMVRVRLEGIDAPERKQDFSAVAQKRLGELCHDKDVRVAVTGKDRYGRTLGTLWVADCNCNLTLVREGLAWHYKQYSDNEQLADAERAAREEKCGLWSRDDAVPPWEFRRKPISTQPLNHLLKAPHDTNYSEG